MYKDNFALGTLKKLLFFFSSASVEANDSDEDSYGCVGRLGTDGRKF
jgi:hypothetical protein